MGEGVGTGAPGQVSSWSSALGSKEALVQHVLGKQLRHRISRWEILPLGEGGAQTEAVVAESQGLFRLCNKYFAT